MWHEYHTFKYAELTSEEDGCQAELWQYREASAAFGCRCDPETKIEEESHQAAQTVRREHRPGQVERADFEQAGKYPEFAPGAKNAGSRRDIWFTWEWF